MIAVYQLKSDKASELFDTDRFTPFMYGTTIDKQKLMGYLKHYELVAHLLTDDLDRAFEIGNIGPEIYYVRHKPMHSVSVGDVLVKDTGETYVVAPAGFDRLGIDTMKDADYV